MSDPAFDAVSLVVVFIGLALGGLIKGATGAGAPVVAVPVIAAFFDVRLAVILMVVPNLVINAWQLRAYHRFRLPGGFSWRFGLAGGAGTLLGTAILARVPGPALSLIVAGAVILYLALRLFGPETRLALPAARRLVWPMGGLSGVLLGAAGISAPVSLSFLNAMRLDRAAFIATISALFTAMSLVQFPSLIYFDLLTWHLLALSAAALVPLFLFMPVGNWLAGRLTPRAFDRLILILLAGLAARLIYAARLGW